MRRLYPLLAALAILAAACGGNGATSNRADAKLAAALDSLTRTDGVTMKLTLESTPESLQALDRHDGGNLTAEDAQKILDSSVTVTTAPKQGATGAARIVVEVAGNPDLELRTVDKTLYVRADVRRLLETFGKNPAMADRFVAQAEAAGAAFVGDLVKGEWIALTGFDELAGAGGATPLPKQQKMLDEVAAALESSTSVRSAGTDDAGEHLVATVSLRRFAEHLREALADLGGAAGPMLPGPSDVPDEDLRLDLWVDGGALTQVELDLLQLDNLKPGTDLPAGVDRLAVRVALADFSGAVQAPANAVRVDLRQLLGGMLGGAASSSGSSILPPQ